MKTSKTTVFALCVALAASGSLIAGPGHDGGRHGGRGKAMLGKLDTDGNGSLTVAEIQASAAKRTQSIDADGNGAITLAEMEAFREQQRAERRAQRFAKLDSNGDGIVSNAEFTESQSKRLTALDVNADGVISEDETHHGRRHRRAHAF